jgi:hypothetical protein
MNGIMDEEEWEYIRQQLDDGVIEEDDLDADAAHAMNFSDYESYVTDKEDNEEEEYDDEDEDEDEDETDVGSDVNDDFTLTNNDSYGNSEQDLISGVRKGQITLEAY